MRICQILPPEEFYSPDSGGAIATVAMQHNRHLIRRGHSVTVLASENKDRVYPVGTVHSIPARCRNNLSFARRRWSDLRRRLWRWDWPYYEYYLQAMTRALERLSPAPEVVIVHNDLVFPRYLRRLLPGVIIVLWLHNENRTRQKLPSKSLAAVDAFVAVSDYIADWTMQRYDLPRQKVFTIANGVDLETFKPRQGAMDRGEQELRVLYLGRIDPNKGPDIAADAVAAIRREGLAARLTIAGPVWWHGRADPNADPYFRDVLKPRMQAAGATYLGHVSRADVPGVFQDHDVACVLSRSNEPFGLTALEAMACGCAVIASNRGGLPQACGGAAQLVDPDDLDSVIRILRKFATDPAALRSLQAIGHRTGKPGGLVARRRGPGIASQSKRD